MFRIYDKRHRRIELELSNVLEDLDYADDLCLSSHTYAYMEAKLDDLRQEAAKTLLKMNTGKTQEMRTFGEEFYTAASRHKDNRTRPHIRRPEELKTTSFHGSPKPEPPSHSWDLFGNQKLTRRVLIKILESYMKSVLLYRCESWKLK